MRSQLRAKIYEVMTALLPLIVMVVVLHLTVVKMPVNLFIQFIIGAVMVLIGMVLFLLGVEIGILPMGRSLGAELPRKGSVALAIGIAFLLGFTATIAEPDVMVLTGQVQKVSNGEISNVVLIGVIAIGVGFFVAMAILRILLNVSIAYLITAGYAIVLILFPVYSG